MTDESNDHSGSVWDTGNEIIHADAISTQTISIDPDTDDEIIGAVPNGKLRELAGMFEQLSERYSDRAPDELKAKCKAREQCARELRHLIEEHSDE